MSTIDDVKTLLGDDNDAKLEVLERRTSEQLKAIISEDYVPDRFDYIVHAVVMKRFNRIGNEGMSTYSQEGLSMTFNQNDFDEFMSELDLYNRSKMDVRVKFL